MTNELPQCDHLILLVGGNPLPNAVAGCHLLKAGGMITLIYSKTQTVQTARRRPLQIEGTEEIAKRLRRWFIDERKVANRVNLQAVDDADAYSIREGVWLALQNGSGSVGLHYSGGTKAMAIHAYRAVSEATKGQAVFSYLNPRTLEMFFDKPGEEAKREPVATAVKISLEEMLFLQTSLLLHRSRPYLITPLLPQTAQAMMRVYVGGGAELEEWKKWVAPFPQRYRKRWYDKGIPRNWKPAAEIYADPLSEQVPTSIGDTLLAELGQSSLFSFEEAWENHRDWADKQKATEQDFLDELLGFLTGGKWLEHYTLDCLQQLNPIFDFHQTLLGVVSARANLKKNDNDDSLFEVDVAAIRGYQLFALSCATSPGKKELKHKVFEAGLRARQLGGDEAGTALVSLAEPGQLVELEQDITQALQSRIKLFGKQDLLPLKERLQDWIEMQIGR